MLLTELPAQNVDNYYTSVYGKNIEIDVGPNISEDVKDMHQW